MTLITKAQFLEPDLVILLFHTNDFEENSLGLTNIQKLYFNEEGQVVNNTEKTGKIKIIESVKNFLRNNFQLYKFIGLRLQKINKIKSALMNLDVITTPERLYPFYDKEPSHEVLVAENITYKLIYAMDVFSKEKGFDFVVVYRDIVPYEVELGITDYSKHVKKALEGRDTDTNRAITKLGNFLEEQNIDYVNLNPWFETHYNEKETLTFNTDPHWNEQGHLIAANGIYQELFTPPLNSRD